MRTRAAAAAGDGPLTREEARRIVESALDASRADETQISIAARAGGNIRFARSAVTTSGEVQDLTVTVAATFGRRSGTVELNDASPDALRAGVRQAEEIARLSPEDPEHVPPLPPQRYRTVSAAHAPATAGFGPPARAGAVAAAIEAGRERATVVAGYLENEELAAAIGNSAGNFGYERRTWLSYSNTARTANGAGSGWAATYVADAARLDAAALARVAAEKAAAARTMRSLEPGTYPVVLEPSAVGSLVGILLFNMDARRADEGRSFLAAPGDGNRLGEKLLSEHVTLATDAADPAAPEAAWGANGVPARRVVYFDRGVVAALEYDRYWAERQGKEPTPGPLNALMTGEERTLEELIRATPRGVLLTRLWYIRELDPPTLRYTGLTRDGTFWIEDGRVSHAVNNFRWNESPLSVLAKVEALSRAVPVGQVEFGISPMLLPAVKAAAFTFSSVSQAV